MQSPIVSNIKYETVDYLPCKVCKGDSTLHLLPSLEEGELVKDGITTGVCLECRIKGSYFLWRPPRSSNNQVNIAFDATGCEFLKPLMDQKGRFVICANCLAYGFNHCEDLEEGEDVYGRGSCGQCYIPKGQTENHEDYINGSYLVWHNEEAAQQLRDYANELAEQQGLTQPLQTTSLTLWQRVSNWWHGSSN